MSYAKSLALVASAASSGVTSVGAVLCDRILGHLSRLLGTGRSLVSLAASGILGLSSLVSRLGRGLLALAAERCGTLLLAIGEGAVGNLGVAGVNSARPRESKCQLYCVSDAQGSIERVTRLERRSTRHDRTADGERLHPRHPIDAPNAQRPDLHNS